MPFPSRQPHLGSSWRESSVYAQERYQTHFTILLQSTQVFADRTRYSRALDLKGEFDEKEYNSTLKKYLKNYSKMAACGEDARIVVPFKPTLFHMSLAKLAVRLYNEFGFETVEKALAEMESGNVPECEEGSPKN
ncbi:hypothetical protein AVEN_117452-1 [Araneus ventricosus]|uniref:Uncharacterized protein n=1 Tax=Araneus ventricosus TaxID=182803 RepID=A0A4Y2RNL1_ARAVE|nr:hypothetical protein AVEN_117452-1 [Araneus ventricosus]